MDTPEKPPTPEPPRETTPGAYLPPKLREKLEAADEGGDWEPKGSSPLPWIVLGVLVLAGGAWGFMALRSNAAKRKAAEEARVAQARADSLAAAATAESLLALMRETTAAASPRPAARAGAAAASTPAAGASGGDPGAEPPTAPSGPYGLAVATYLFEDRAETERERLAASTGLPARIVSATEGGATVYRLILGSFDSRASAERKAAELTGQNLVREAKVVPLSRS
jgi:cell division protein FtsN